MASILRSSKFVRYFAGFARSVVFNTAKETEGSLVQQSQCLCNSLTQGFATAASKPDQNLERSLKRLDQDVRRSGRISRRDIEEVLEEIRLQRSATSSQSLLVIRCCGNLVPEELPEVRTSLVQEIWKTLNNLKVPMDISHYNALLRVYLENEHPFSPTEFLTDLESKGIEPNRVTYQRLIARYCQQGDIEGATRILEFMREKQHPVNENVFNALIMGHSQADDMESASGILSVMQQASLEPSADTYTTLLCGYARKGDIGQIQSTLETCEQKEIYLLDKDILDVVYALTLNGHGDLIDPIVNTLRKSVGYNQDAINLILRLTNKGYEDVAFKILKTMTRGTKGDGELVDTGNFFIKQLVKANCPSSKILNICKELQDDGSNTRALLTAIESGLSLGLVETALPLLKEAHKSGLPIRQHYFWPLLCSESKNGNDNILAVLKQMQDEFNITPSGETIREYVIPNIKEKNFDKLISLLRSVGISNATASTSTAYHVLTNNNIKSAAEISTNYSAFYSPGLFRKPLVAALSKTNDYESYIKIVRQLHDSLVRGDNLGQKSTEEETETQTTQSTNQADILGQIVHDIVVYFRKDRVEILENVLKGLVEQGLSISSVQAEKIQDKLGSELTSEVSTLLSKLTSGDLEPIAAEKSLNKGSGVNYMDVQQIERLIITIEGKGENVKSLKRHLLSACFKSKDLNKTEEVINKLKDEGYVIATGVYAQLIELYCHHSKAEKAITILNEIKTKEPDFVLDDMKTIKLASLLIAEDKLDEALKILETNKKEEKKTEEVSFNYKAGCWRLLNSLAEAGKLTELEKVFDSLVKNNYIEINNVMLGPLVKVHLVNNDLTKAVETFEHICNTHRSTPWKNELACRLIQAEDATNLQKLTDLSTNIHGEVNSLYDLVFSFVECGRIRQARKILETPGLRNRPQRINMACERYHQDGIKGISPLEGLMEATKDLNHINRAEIYYNLLLSYCKENEPDKALGLWTKMQEENIGPSDAFLIKLAEFLKSKNLEIPFVVPEKELIVKKVAPTPQKTERTELKKKVFKELPTAATIAISETVTQLRQALKSNDIDQAIQIKQKITDADKLSVTDQSVFIESLVKADRLNESSKVVLQMLDANLHPIPRIFRFYLNKIAATGDIKTIEQIGEKITPEMKKIVSFDNRICHANIVAGKSEQYLKQLEDNLVNAKTDEELKNVQEKFPRGGAVGILDLHPELTEKFEELAEKYAERGIIAPMNVLWSHHFVNENIEVSDRIWDKYLAKAPRLMFQRIVHLARERQDDKLIQRLIVLLKKTQVSEGAIGNAYSCLLDVYASKEQFDDGLIALDSAVKDVCLENINRTALQRIKTGVEKSGKSFPYKLPEKTNKPTESSSSSSSSSGSSSSSDEETNK